jgi:hypothetical protein
MTHLLAGANTTATQNAEVVVTVEEGVVVFDRQSSIGDGIRYVS